MHNPRWNNKVVVMIWEHKHIADAKLESSTKEHVTLRQLLNLDKMESAVSIPESWSDDNYDFFWIATYGKRSSKIPTKFEAIQQDYPDTSIPSNAWNVWTTLPPDCDNQPDPATP